jgi:hypothetical protein
VFEPSRPAPQILLGYRRIRRTDLHRDIVDRLGRHIQRILQKQAQRPHRGHLQTEPDPVLIPSSLRDQVPVRVIEEEKAFQLRRRQPSREPAIRRRLLISEELNRHRPKR